MRKIVTSTRLDTSTVIVAWLGCEEGSTQDRDMPEHGGPVGGGGGHTSSKNVRQPCSRPKNVQIIRLKGFQIICLPRKWEMYTTVY
jgi:hypothetical protein